MIICSSCGAENESHYKFCLGCGKELIAPSATTPSSEVKKPTLAGDSSDLKQKLNEMRERKLSDSPGLIPSFSQPPSSVEPEEASFESLHTMVDQDATSVEPLPGIIDGVGYADEKSGVYGTATESATPPPGHSTDAQGIGGIDTVRVSEELKAVKPEPAPTDADASPNVGETTPCPECVGPLVGYRFCGSCGIDKSGTTTAEPTESDTVSLLAELVFIHPSGEDGERLAITEKDTILGRESDFGLLQSTHIYRPSMFDCCFKMTVYFAKIWVALMAYLHG